MWSNIYYIFHVGSLGRALAFRADDPGFEPRLSMTRHIHYYVDANVHIYYKMNSAVLFCLFMHFFKVHSEPPLKKMDT